MASLNKQIQRYDIKEFKVTHVQFTDCIVFLSLKLYCPRIDLVSALISPTTVSSFELHYAWKKNIFSKNLNVQIVKLSNILIL